MGGSSSKLNQNNINEYKKKGVVIGFGMRDTDYNTMVKIKKCKSIYYEDLIKCDKLQPIDYRTNQLIKLYAGNLSANRLNNRDRYMD